MVGLVHVAQSPSHNHSCPVGLSARPAPTLNHLISISAGPTLNNKGTPLKAEIPRVWRLFQEPSQRSDLSHWGQIFYCALWYGSENEWEQVWKQGNHLGGCCRNSRWEHGGRDQGTAEGMKKSRETADAFRIGGQDLVVDWIPQLCLVEGWGK